MSQEFNPALIGLSGYRIVVLLIDDQKIIGEAVRRLLSDEPDIEFHFCADPKLALAEAKRLKPTLILQDLVMPDINGLTLVQAFRADPATRRIPLIVLSSTEEPRTKAEAFALGANDYLIKLPDRVELIARLRYHSRAYIAQLERDEAYSRLIAELNEAAEYVRSLLPQPRHAGVVRSAWEFVPCTSLGGDAFGYFESDDDHFVMFVLDVCGHGIGTALLSLSAMNALLQGTLPGFDAADPSAVLTAMNQAFSMEQHNQLYFTLWYGVLHRPTRRLRYTSAGHPPAILVDASGQVTELVPPFRRRKSSCPHRAGSTWSATEFTN
jgi:phosphoserine phosphatase RsbU/P